MFSEANLTSKPVEPAPPAVAVREHSQAGHAGPPAEWVVLPAVASSWPRTGIARTLNPWTAFSSTLTDADTAPCRVSSLHSLGLKRWGPTNETGPRPAGSRLLHSGDVGLQGDHTYGALRWVPTQRIPPLSQRRVIGGPVIAPTRGQDEGALGSCPGA